MSREDRHRAPRRPPSRISRRTFLRGGLIAGGLAAAGGVIAALTSSGGGGAPATDTVYVPPPGGRRRDPTAARPRQRQPNILVVMVDQLRTPRWLPQAQFGSPLIPNISALARDSVSFGRHFTAANDCTPSRAALLTGLYTHQTGCMITSGSTLDPGFPTWGSMLREHGYQTYWYGKWHLTRGDSSWVAPFDARAFERYGFAGGTYPSPDGAPGQGMRVDPMIARQFELFLDDAGGQEPWCTTVSFVNPHDIAFWYRYSNQVPAEASSPARATGLPPNFETPDRLIAQGKPTLQRSLQDTAANSFGAVPFNGPATLSWWLPFLDLYLQLMQEVDIHVGTVMRALAGRPRIAANTVVVFTSDHGEYGGSHGMRGKGASVYEEAIRVPLLLKDPRGKLTRHPGPVRQQLTSSVDVAPLLLTIGTGSAAWRHERHYAHLASRLDLASILANPGAPGRKHVLHATDEIVTEFATQEYAASAPLHVVGLRTPIAKYAAYSDWSSSGIEILSQGQETELYDYRTHGGRLELENAVGRSPLEAPMHAALEHAIAHELRAPLPARLRAAQRRGLADYANVKGHADVRAAESRLAAERALAEAASALSAEKPRGRRRRRRRRPPNTG